MILFFFFFFISDTIEVNLENCYYDEESKKLKIELGQSAKNVVIDFSKNNNFLNLLQ